MMTDKALNRVIGFLYHRFEPDRLEFVNLSLWPTEPAAIVSVPPVGRIPVWPLLTCLIKP